MTLCLSSAAPAYLKVDQPRVDRPTSRSHEELDILTQKYITPKVDLLESAPLPQVDPGQGSSTYF